MKDFNGSKYIKDLIDAGICSFKIEGRLKDIGYVKNIVSYYRSLLGNGTSSGKIISLPFIPNPEKSFNRGFTDYFLNGHTNCFNFESPKSRGEYLGEVTEIRDNRFKIKTNKTINPQDGLYFNGEGCLVNKVADNYIYPNKKVDLKIKDNVYRNIDIEFEKLLKKPVKRQIGINIKVKDSIIAITDEDNVSVNYTLKGETPKNPEKMKETFIKQFSKTGNEDFYIENFEINSEIPFMPVSDLNELRRNLVRELMKNLIEKYNSEKLKQPQMKYTKFYLDEVDYKANVHNETAKNFYEKCGVKVLEPSLETKIPKKQIQLMRCKHCIKYALNMCKSPQNLLLKDENNKLYPLKFDCKNCEMSVMSNYC